jgi:hypothetical protein
MISHGTREQIQNIILGISIEATGDSGKTTRNFLAASYQTSTKVKTDFEGQSIIKEDQSNKLRRFADQHNLWVRPNFFQELNFIAQGGESKIYLKGDNKHVVKINDAGYYATWLEYFNSLVLHNLFFTGTSYTFIGFFDDSGSLKAVVRQPYIIAAGQAKLEKISEFLSVNGFENTSRQDYFNNEFGIILEDMHDENVILQSDTLFFIDTVFYTVAVKKE